MDAVIARHLQGVSRTYAILIPMLPCDLAESVGLAYLLMRIVDTLEDAPQLSAPQRAELLLQLEAALDNPATDTAPLRIPIGDSLAEHNLMLACDEVLTRLRALPPEPFAATRRCAQTMSAGVRSLLERCAVRGLEYPGNQDAAELRTYCYYVAGVVGEMLCALMAQHLRSPALLRLNNIAIELGIGLQLVNILKDSLKDARQGRRYLPVTSAGDVRGGEVYRAVLAEARESLQRGAEFVLALPATARELRSFCGLPIAWGAMTLARAERSAAGAKIDRGAIRSSIELFRRLAGNDQALRAWFARLLSPAPAATAGR